METKFELITPERAKKMLEKNTMNRMPSKRMVSEYARQMRNGLWYEDTGESIKIAYDGTLLDGQQRLLALIEADISLNFKIDYDLDKIAFKFIDTGKKRTAGDTFHCLNILNARSIAAGIRRYLALKLNKTIGVPSSHAGGGGVHADYSNSEMLSIYEKNPLIWEGAHNMSTNWYNKSGRLLKISEFIAFYMFFRDIDENDAFNFMTKFGEGIGLSNNDSIKLLRERLTDSKSNPTMNITGYVKTGLIIKAWNYFRDNTQIKVLRFSPNLDHFPVAK